MLRKINKFEAPICHLVIHGTGVSVEALKQIPPSSTLTPFYLFETIPVKKLSIIFESIQPSWNECAGYFLQAILRHNNHIEELICAPTAVFFKYLPQLPHLRTLKLSLYNEEDCNILADAITSNKFPALETLDLSHNLLFGMGAGGGTICNAIHYLTQLRDLNLSHTGASSFQPDMLARTFSHPSLTAIDLSGNTNRMLNEEIFFNLNNRINTPAPLKELHLGIIRSYSTNDTDLHPHLAAFIARFPGLTTLGVHFQEISRWINNLHDVLNVLTKLPHLTALDLSHSKISKLSTQTLVNALCKLPQITRLYLANNNLRPKEISHILKSLPHLKTLDVSAESTTNLGAVEELKIGLSYAAALEELDLRRYNWSADKLKTLVSAVSHLPLKRFYLGFDQHTPKSQTTSIALIQQLSCFSSMTQLENIPIVTTTITGNQGIYPHLKKIYKFFKASPSRTQSVEFKRHGALNPLVVDEVNSEIKKIISDNQNKQIKLQEEQEAKQRWLDSVYQPSAVNDSKIPNQDIELKVEPENLGSQNDSSLLDSKLMHSNSEIIKHTLDKISNLNAVEIKLNQIKYEINVYLIQINPNHQVTQNSDELIAELSRLQRSYYPEGEINWSPEYLSYENERYELQTKRQEYIDTLNCLQQRYETCQSEAERVLAVHECPETHIQRFNHPVHEQGMFGTQSPIAGKRRSCPPPVTKTPKITPKITPI